MVQSRLISQNDLITAGFNTQADDWANDNGVLVSVSKITVAAYTLTNIPNKLFTMDRTTSQTFTIPTGMTAWKPNNVLSIAQIGTGAVTVIAGSGVTLLNPGADLLIPARYRIVQFIQIEPDIWIACGFAETI